MSTTVRDIQTGRLRALLNRLALPVDDWARKSGGRRVNTLLLAMGVVVAILVLAALSAVFFGRTGASGWLALLLVLLTLGAGMTGVLMYQIHNHLLRPLTELRAWALRMCDGDLSARIPLPQKGQFAKLTFHINRLSEALDKLANEMDDVVSTQTEGLQEKNRSLEILYGVAASISTSRDIDDLLERSAKNLMDVVNAQSATVRLRNEEGEMHLIKRIGFGDDASVEALATRAKGNAFSELEALQDKKSLLEDVAIDGTRVGGDRMGLVTIPLRHQSENLGVYSLLTPTPELAEGAEARKLLLSVGKHLGMAIAKARLDKESRNLSIVRERTSLAHELHDSLAQTLASLRFQVKMLAETLQDTPEASRELDRIRNGLDEANTELRELLANFRAPIDERGLLPAIEDIVGRFRKDSGIVTYFQTECKEMRLPAAYEMQVLRIVREALTNIRKHSGAQTARVLLRYDGESTYRVLIEDDGVGIGMPVLEGRPGEHIGLSIMQERARRVGGALAIESEPGEGTRVLFTFSVRAAEPGIRAGD